MAKVVSKADIDAYNDDSIVELKPLHGVRKRLGMYIYDDGMKGFTQLFTEIFDNSIDEAQNGFGDLIKVILNADGSLTVRDTGRGLPIGMYRDTGKSTIEKMLTTIHMGGKMSSGNYKLGSSGLHGVGSSVVVALSDWYAVKVFREGHEYHFKLKYVKPSSEHPEDYEILDQLHIANDIPEGVSGTEVTFLPSDKVFGKLKWDKAMIISVMRDKAFLLPNVTFKLYDHRVYKDDYSVDDENELLISGHDADIDILDSKALSQETRPLVFHLTDGIGEYVKTLSSIQGSITPLMEFKVSQPNMHLDVAMQWTRDYGEKIESFVNTVATVDGGTHVTGLKSVITRVFNDYAKTNKLLKGKATLSGDDLRDGLVCIISLNLTEELLSFEGQTKGKLSKVAVRGKVEDALYLPILGYLQQNTNVADKIIDKALLAKKVRDASRRAKKLARKGKDNIAQILNDKVTNAIGKDFSKRELFIAEGDSAIGSVKQARDRRTQGTLAIRGKSLNTETLTYQDVLKNQEFTTLISVLGTGFGEDFDIKKLKYNKIIIMTDADQDGKHIRLLLLTFFFRYMTQLVKDGHVYISYPPLFRVFLKKDASKSIYCWSDSEVEDAKKKLKGNVDIMRFKGLGEMDVSQLEATSMKIGKRRLQRVKISDYNDADHLFTILMGNSAEARRKVINRYAQFDKLDED